MASWQTKMKMSRGNIRMFCNLYIFCIQKSLMVSENGITIIVIVTLFRILLTRRDEMAIFFVFVSFLPLIFERILCTA